MSVVIYATWNRHLWRLFLLVKISVKKVLKVLFTAWRKQRCQTIIIWNETRTYTVNHEDTLKIAAQYGVSGLLISHHGMALWRFYFRCVKTYVKKGAHGNMWLKQRVVLNNINQDEYVTH